MLRNAKINRSGVDLKIKVKPIEPERRVVLVEKLKQGEDVNHELILGHLGLAMSIASRFIFFNRGRKKEDIVGQTLYLLVDGVERFREVGRDEHIDWYLQTHISRGVQRYLNRDHTVKPPISQWVGDLHKEEGREGIERIFGVLSYEHMMEIDDEENYTVKGTPYHEDQRDLGKELIESGWFTTRECEILRQRIEGKNDEEIGRSIGMSYARVSQLRKEMRTRVQKLLS